MKIRCRFDEMLSIEVLKTLQFPHNPNKHSPEQIKQLAAIMRYQGIRHPIVIAKTPRTIMTKGHGRLLAAIENGWHEFPIELQDYDSEEMLYSDVVADNAIALQAELDLASINLQAPDLGPDFNISWLGIKDFVIEPADKYGDKDADAIPEIKTTDIQTGDLFQLGTHRLLCGDSTDRESVDRLMNGEKADMVLTDPPYGMFLNADYSNLKGGKKYSNVQGDHEDFDPAHILNIFEYCEEILLFGANYYSERLIDKNKGSWIVWDKRFEDGKLDYAIENIPTSEFELIWSKKKHHQKIARFLRSQGFYAPKEDRAPHPTLKPTKLLVWLLDKFGKDRNLIADLYLGSGSTLIACEKTSRRCFGMEIDPQYVQVAIDRFIKFVGSDKDVFKLEEDGRKTPWAEFSKAMYGQKAAKL